MRPSRRAGPISFASGAQQGDPTGRAPGVHLVRRSQTGASRPASTRKPKPRRTRRSTGTRTVETGSAIQKIKLALQEGVQSGVKTLRATSFSQLFVMLVLVAVVCFVINSQMRLHKLERLFRELQ